MRRLFFVSGKNLGESPITPLWGEPTPRSYAFFCPVCAEVWAKCPVLPTEATITPYMVWTRCCSSHFRHRGEIPGSVGLVWDPEYESNWPLALLHAEVISALANYERNYT